jgi:hypothetical protein
MAEKNTQALRIMNQFRSRTGFVYDLKCEAARLTVSIAQRQSAADPGEWSVEARAGVAPDVAPIAAWASTRRDALREVGLAWASQAATLGLPAFDWEAIATALSDVRAV